MRRLGFMAVVVAAGASCSPAPNLLPVNDLDRPTDVAFMCFGAFEPGQTADGGVADAGMADAGMGLRVSGRPMRSCHPPGQYDPPAGPGSRTFAFMPNSASGGLTMVDADNWKLVDLDPSTGGYGQLPLGELPTQISVSDDGCRLISANQGSCDLTLVDPSVLVVPLLDQQDSQDAEVPMSRTATETIRPVKGDGTFLTAAPYEAVFLPQNTSGLEAGSYLCGGAGELAKSGPAGWGSPVGTSIPWYALVTYPSCDLIVLIELPSGKIVQSVKVVEVRSMDGKSDTVRFVDQGPSPSCTNSDCIGQSLPPADGAAGAVDAGQSPSVDANADATGPPSDGAVGGVDAGVQGSPVFPGIQLGKEPYVGSVAGPSSIAIVPGGGQVYVSLSNASYVASFGLSSAGLALPGNAVLLNEGARGSDRIRLNVDPYRYKTLPAAGALYSGAFIGADEGIGHVDLEFLYVIAKDGTLRVVQVYLPGAEQECETNVDPMNPLAAGLSPTTACIPVNPGIRRPFAVGPGIHFPTVPIDVAAADIRVAPTADHSEQSVNGGHAWVITASGIVYLVNIDPVLRNFSAVEPGAFVPPPQTYARTDYPSSATPTSESPPFVSSLRDRNEISYSLTLDPSSGPPRVDVLPSVQAAGPYIEPFWALGSDNNATALTNDFVETEVFFPKMPLTAANFQDPIDRRGVTAQTWTVIWEGALIGQRYSGRVQRENLATLPTTGSSPGPRGSLFQDGGGNFCGSGVLPGDMVTLSGCTVNSQCGLGEGCLVDTTVTTAAGGVPVTGLCVDPNRVDAQSASCARFLSSVRRYEVVTPYQSQLVIRPHLDELVRSSLMPCHPADPDNPVVSDCPDPNDPTTNKFTCETVYPSVGMGPRCLMKGCVSDSDCRIGRSCVDFDATEGSPPACADGHCFCADAPPLDQVGAGCFDQLVGYQVNIGNGFLVSGSQTGFISTAKLPTDPNQPCTPDPKPDPRFTFRIPMDAPLCTNMPGPQSQSMTGSPVYAIDSRTDPETVPMTATYFDAATMTNMTFDPQARATNDANTLLQIAETPPTPDPCLYVGGPVGTEATVDPTLLTPPPAPQHVRAIFRNSQISFVLANVDRQPTGQFQTGFDVHGGFAAQVVQDPTTVEISMPARIVVGPIDSQAQLPAATNTPPYEVPYLFVVDQRRLGRSEGGGPTRGQLLRIHPLGFTSSVGVATGTQPIFQDYTASGGVFPIQ